MREHFFRDERISRFARRLLRPVISVMVCTLCLAIPASALAQSRTLTGVVKDNAGNPVAGATVIVDGTSQATSTSLTGEFTLPAVEGAVTLQVSYIGYQTARQAVPATTAYVQITLAESSTTIDDVVVVGYGTQKKATLTGSVVAVDNEQLVTTKAQDVRNMMTGKLPGVRSVQGTSEPGVFDKQMFDIRGFGSPLIVIDGVVRTDVERMDPNDIESVSVLKDASAAIYGARSSNGVVLITTKKGAKGKPTIEYSMYYGMQFPAEIMKPVGAYDRFTMMNEKSMRAVTSPKLNYSLEDVEKARTGEIKTYDWYDKALLKWAPQQQHNVSVSGGSDAADYYLNFGYMEQQGFFSSRSFNYDRYNLRSNINLKINDDLTVGMRLSGITDKRERPQTDAWDLFKSLWRTVSDDKFYANDTYPYYSTVRGDIKQVLAASNADYAGYKWDKRQVFNSTFEANYNVRWVEGLTARASFSYDNAKNDNTNYRKEYNLYSHGGKNDAGQDVYSATTKDGPNSIERSFSNADRKMWNAGLNFDRTFGEVHRVTALAIYEETQEKNDNFAAYRQLLMPMPYLFVGQALNQEARQNAGGLNEYANRALVSRVEYGYNERYLAEVDYRYDGSSRFLPGKKWDHYYGFLAAWRLSEESFIKDHLTFVDNLKLRASWAKLGDDGSNLYEFLGGYDYPGSGSPQSYPSGYYFGNAFVPGLGFRDVPNPSIGWVDIKTINVGLDAEFWNGMLGVTVDIFQRQRDGIYARQSDVLPSTFGAGMAQQNLDSDRTRGFELSLSHRHRIGEVTYSVTGNLSLTRRMNLTKTQSPFSSSYNEWFNNKSDRYSDIWFGWGDAGRYTSYEQIANYPVRDGNNSEKLPGDYIYEDWNGDGVIDDEDRYPIATTADPSKSNWNDKKNHPLAYFAFGGNAQWRGFDIDFMFQGAALSYVAYGEMISAPLRWDGNALGMHLDRWRPTDPTADPYNPATQWIKGHFAYGSEKSVPRDNSRAAIQNGAYLRLKTVTLGYTLPRQWVSKVGIDNLRLYVSAYNLLTFTSVVGVDPEKPAELNGYMYPLNKTINFGASLKF